MTTPDQRLKMAKAIIDFEARRDKDGHLAVYNLPANDGGGRYEVCGINERYDKPVCDKLVDLIHNKKFDEAERTAEEYIAANTDPAGKLTNIPSVEFMLRDIVFNRGVKGMTVTLQHAVGTGADGVVGPQTKAAIKSASENPQKLLQDLRDAREWYERNKVGYRANFWNGLTNRWNNSLKVAKTFPDQDEIKPDVIATPKIPTPANPPAKPKPHEGSWWEELLERGVHAVLQHSDPTTPAPATVPTVPTVPTIAVEPPKPVPAPDDPVLHNLVNRVYRTMVQKGMVVRKGKGKINIAAVEGMDPDGKKNQNRHNAFDDIKLCFTFGDDPNVAILAGGPWEATTEPGSFWTERPMNPGGAAHIALGQELEKWQMGEYHDQPALRECAPIHFTRDPDCTFKRYGTVHYEDIAVHHHGGYNYPHDDMGRSSAGCQVIRLVKDHLKFIDVCKGDPSYQADKNFKFSAAVLTADEILP